MRPGILVGRARAVRPLTILTASVIVSTVAVCAAIPFRWEGSRTGQDAYVPLRPLSPREAAALLSVGRAAVIVGLSDDNVLVVAGAYLVPFAGMPGQEPVEGRRIAHGGIQYAMHSTSWENHVSLHRLNRRELEQALGRALSPADVDANALAERRISFVSHHLWRYALIEIGFLAALLSALLLALQRMRNLLLLVPLWVVLEAIVAVFVRFYSPAFYDADWFHQRILVEELVLVGLIPLALGNPLGIAGLCLLGYAVARLGTWLRPRRRVSSRRYWIAVAACTSAVLITLLLVDYPVYLRERRSAERVIDAVGRALDPRTTTRLKAEVGLTHSPEAAGRNLYAGRAPDDPLIRTIEQVLDVARIEGGQDVAIFVPLDQVRFLFLSRTEAFHYADVRQLTEGPTRVISYDAITEMQATGKDLTRGFLSFLRRRHLAGRLVAGEPGSRPTIVLVASDFMRVPTLMGKVVWLLGWRTYL